MQPPSPAYKVELPVPAEPTLYHVGDDDTALSLYTTGRAEERPQARGPYKYQIQGGGKTLIAC